VVPAPHDEALLELLVELVELVVVELVDPVLLVELAAPVLLALLVEDDEVLDPVEDAPPVGDVVVDAPPAPPPAEGRPEVWRAQARKSAARRPRSVRRITAKAWRRRCGPSIRPRGSAPARDRHTVSHPMVMVSGLSARSRGGASARRA
jgi:hypothetical protein